MKQVNKIISSTFPDLKVEQIRLLGEGGSNKVYEVNKEYIFRFPKTLDAEKNVKKEVVLLQILQHNVDLLIPEIKFISHPERFSDYGKTRFNFLNTILAKIESKLNQYHTSLDAFNIWSKSDDKIFIGYQKIPGSELQVDIFDNLSLTIKENLAKKLANFLLYLHSLPIETYHRGMDVWNFGGEYYASFYEKITTYILPNISEQQRELLLKFYFHYLNHPDYYQYNPCLIHGDLAFNNIMFDSQSMQVGIIDFGNVSIGDPDYDFFYLYADYGEDFYHKVLTYYGGNFTEKIENKFNMLFCCIGAELMQLGEEEKKAYLTERGWKFFKKFLENLKKKR